MSRLIVKNLPKTITDEKIRELFNQYGTITDVQLKYTKKKVFREFAFIGFSNDSDAERAIENLHNTFLNTRKISVEKCALLGDSEKPKAWSKHSSDSTAFKKANFLPSKEPEVEESKLKEKAKRKGEDDIEKILEKYKDDPMFEEFLQVHGDKNKLEKLKKVQSKPSDTDDNNQDDNEENEDNDEKVADQPISDLEYMNMLKPDAERKPRQKMEKKVKEKVVLFHLKLKDLPYKVKKKDIKDFFRENMPFSIRIPRNTRGIVFVGYKNEKGFKKALLKDKSVLRGRQIRVLPHEEIEKNTNNNNESKNNKWKNQEEALKNEEGIAESGRIFVRNLSYTTVEKDIEELFSKFGELTEINLPIDNVTKQPKGFAVVTFMFPEFAVKAYSELDGSILHGRMLHLLPGKAKDVVENEDQTFKQKKADKQKSNSSSSHNWNTLFLGHDAVAQVIAENFDVSKEAVVGPEAKGSAAVRLALGETQIVAQTRKYLQENGVLIDVFSQAPKNRSKTVILVKNLPNKTEAKEIREIFEPHGQLGRVILPPSGITAIVEFLEPSEARKAFLKVAYSKFKNVPLYLEWAPENVLEDPKAEKLVKPDKIIINEEIESTNNDEELDDGVEPEPDSTLFVKNVNFQTTDESLRKHFQNCGKIKYATIATKKDPKNAGQKLSMGYGFVQFYFKKDTDKALKTLQQSVLDGKSLELKRSERTLKSEANHTARKTVKLTKQTGSKILVRNIPFQANKTDIWELFSSFGEIKALRLPKKMTPGEDSHRGFAFIDYTTPNDAKAAFEALSQSTHLFGRRLVLEWASGEEEIEELRKRTAEHFGKIEEVKSKKSVFNIDD